MFKKHKAVHAATMSDGPRLNELEFLKTNGVIDDEEIRNLNVGRKIFVKQIENGDISIERCLQQIREESKLLDLCHAKINVGETELDVEEGDKENILAKMANRINHLYFSMFHHYPVNASTITSYMTFFLNYKRYITINSNLFYETLSKKHKDPKVYISAAEVLYDNTSDVDVARRLIAIGLKYHSRCKKLHMCDFWFETQLLHDDGGESFPIALRMYKKLLKMTGGDLVSLMKLLDCTTRFNESGELQLHVMKDLVDLHGTNELMWPKLANTYLNGLIFDRNKKSLKNDQLCESRNSEDDNHSMMQEQLYKDGLRSVGYNDLAWPMWEYMISLINTNLDYKSVIKFYELGINHPQAEISMKLQHKYLLWTKSTRGILATRRLFRKLRNTKPTCLKLYLFMIKLERSLKEPKWSWVIKLCFEACKTFGRGCIRLWKDTIQLAYENGEHTKARKIFKWSSSYLEPDVMDELKNQFEFIKDEYAKRHILIDPNSIDFTDDDGSPPDHQRKNNCPPTTKDNCPPTSKDNCHSKSTDNYRPVSTKKKDFEQLNMHEYAERYPNIDSIVIDITGDDDSPPDHQRKNNCPSTSKNNCPSKSTDNCLPASTDTFPPVSTEKNEFEKLNKHEYKERHPNIDLNVIDITDDDDDSPPDHQRKNNFPPISKDNCPSKSTDNCRPASTDTFPSVSAEKNKFGQLNMHKYAERHPNIDSIVIDITDDDDSPPDHQRKNICLNYLSSSSNICPPVSTQTNEFEQLFMHEYRELHPNIDSIVIDISDDDDSPPNHQRKNNFLPTSGSYCSSTSTYNNPSTSIDNYYLSSSSDTCTSVSTQINEFEQFLMELETIIDSIAIDILNADDSPPDYQRTNNCLLTSGDYCPSTSTDTCPPVSTQNNEFEQLFMHEYGKRHPNIDPNIIVISDEDDLPPNL